MSSSPRAGAFALLGFALLSAGGCRESGQAGRLRIALPPFENLTGNPAHDWIGRAAPEVLRYQLRTASGLEPLPVESRGDASGVRAARILYGYYTESRGVLEFRAVLTGSPAGRDAARYAAAGGVVAACDQMARALAPAVRRFATGSDQALRLQTEALMTRDPAAARAGLEKALAADAAFGPAYLSLIRLLAAERDASGALAAAARSNLQGERIDAIDRLEIAIFAAGLRGEQEERVKLLTALSKLTPGDASLMRAIGEAKLRAGRTARAAEWFHRAAAAEPDFALGWNSLAYAQAYLGDRSAALKSVERYRQLDPGGANPLDSAGEIHFHFGAFEEAARCFLDAHAKDSGFLAGGALHKAAWARLLAGDRRAAGELHERFLAARAELKDPLVPIRRAQWEMVTGQGEAALKGLEDLAAGERERNPELAALAGVQLALWRVQMGDRAQARELAAAALGRAQSAQSRLLAALAGFLARDPAPAGEWRARAEEAFPGAGNLPFRQLALSLAFLHGGHFAEAAELLRARFEQSADSPLREVAELYAWALEASGKKDEAARLLRTWAVPDPRAEGWFSSLVYPRALLLRARAADARGDRSEATRLRDLFHQCAGGRPDMSGGG